MTVRGLLVIGLLYSSAGLSVSIAAPTEATDIYTAFKEKPAAEDQASENGASGETVAIAIQAALRHNPRVDIANAQLDAAKADRLRAFGQFLPEIEATAAYTNDDLRSSTLQTLQDRDGTTVGVTASQPIFQGLSALNRYRESRARLTQSDFALLAALQGTALDAARAHAGVILARAIVDHRVENLNLVTRQFQITERRMEAGAQSRTGVEQARMRRAQTQVDLAQARAVLAEREAAYERIVGHAPPPDLVQNNDKEVVSFSSLDEAQTVALENNPSLNAARQAVKAVEYAKSAAKGDFAPSLALEGSYFRRFGEDSLLAPQQDEEYQLVARMRMPIFQQGRNIAGLRSAGATVTEQRGQMTNTQLGVTEAVARSWRQFIEVRTRRIAAEGGIDAAALSVKGLQIEYEAGQRTVIDVLDGQRDLVTAYINLSQAEHDYFVAQYELASATGLILDYAGEMARPEND